MNIGVAGLIALLSTMPAGAGAGKTGLPKIRPKTAPSQAVKPALPRSPSEAYIAAGLAKLESDKYSLAIKDFSHATQSSGGGKAYQFLAYSHYQRGFAGKIPETADKADAIEALKAYSIVAALDPHLKSVSEPHRLYQRMGFCYEALGSNDKALEAYSRAFRLAPKNPLIPLYGARLRYKMGNSVKSASNLAAAFKTAQRPAAQKALAKIVATPPFAAMLRSPAHLAVLNRYDPAPGKSEPALIAMRDAVRGVDAEAARGQAMANKDGPLMSRLAVANQELKSRRFHQALSSYTEVIMLNQESGVLSRDQLAVIHGRMGAAYNGLGLADDAIVLLRRSIRDLPYNAAAHYQLALAYSVSGRFNKSLEALGEALKTAPSISDRRRYKLLAKSDSELAPVRDLPGFKKMLVAFN